MKLITNFTGSDTIRILFLIFLLLVVIQPLVDLDRQGNRVVILNQLKADPYVAVSAESTSGLKEELILRYYSMRIMGRSKQQAYIAMMKSYQKLVALLIRTSIIPSEKTFIRSQIKPQYLQNKRKWSFTLIFVLYGTEEAIQESVAGFSGINIHKLDRKPSINFLNEKMLALNSFNSAKQKANQFLSKFPGYEISGVTDIELTGLKSSNSDIIEQQIEQEFNHSEQSIEEEDIDEVKKGEEANLDQVVRIRVVFRVRDINNEGESQEENSQSMSSDDGSDSDSDSQL